MNGVIEVPLLAGLPKVELAKLLSDMEEREVTAGAPLLSPADLTDWVYFILSGEAQVICIDNERVVPVLPLGPGDMVDQALQLTTGRGMQEIRAVTSTRICRLPSVRLQRLLASEPKVVREYNKVMAARNVTVLSELAQSRVMLAAYTDAVWGSVPPATEAATAMSSRETVSTRPLSRRQRHAKTPTRTIDRASVRRWTVMGLTVAGAAITYRLTGGTPALAAATAILFWATSNWLTNVVPDYAVGLAAAMLLVLTGAVKASVAFGGFASPSWFLLLGAGGIGVAVSRSGLLYRAALHMLRLLPPTYLGQSLALAVTGLLFTPLLPSANSRVAMASPLARELSEAMRFSDRSRGAAGLSMATFLGFGLMYFIFLNGSNTSLLAWSLLPSDVQHQVTWATWLLMALPMGVLMFGGLFLSIMRLYPPEPTAGVSRKTIETQLQVLGPMSRIERLTTYVLITVLVGFITQFLHGVDPAWMALSGFLVLLGSSVIDKQGLKAIDWNFLLLFGTLISLSEVTKVTGLSDQLAAWILPVLNPLGVSPYLFLGAVGLLTLVIRLIIPLQPTVLVMIVSLLPVATQMGYNPFTVAIAVLALSNNWVVPQQNSVYIGVYSATDERAFTHEQTRPLAIAHAAIGLLALLASVPVWQMIGLVPH